MKVRQRSRRRNAQAPPLALTYGTNAGRRRETEPVSLMPSLPIGRRDEISVWRLQQTAGNRAVGRMLAEKTPQVRRQGDAGGSRQLQAPLFARDPKLEAVLNDRDRLRVGDRGGPVKKVQQALLNDDMPLPQFAADGVYGGETSSAVKQFKAKHALGFEQFGDVGPGTMAKLDELNTPKNIDPPKKKDPPRDNEALEDMLDNVWLQHQVLLDTQRDALTRLEADLAVEEKAADLEVAVMKLIVKTAVGALFGGAGGLLTEQITDALKDEKMSDDDLELVKSGLEAVFEAAKEAVATEAEEKVADLMAKGEKGVDAFIDAQRATLLDVSAGEQETFLLDVKPRLRTPATAGENDPAEDPRVARARKLAASIKKKRTSAFDMQYTESLARFAIGQAREKLGVTADAEQGTDMSAAGFAKLKQSRDDTLRGVIELDIDFDQDDVSKPVKVDSAEILGLSAKSRDRLSKSDVSILGTGMPVLAAGTEIKVGKETELKISQNENGRLFDSGSDAEGRAWLAARGRRARNQLPDLPGSDDIAAGIDDVFRQDIDRVKLKDLGDKLEKA